MHIVAELAIRFRAQKREKKKKTKKPGCGSPSTKYILKAMAVDPNNVPVAAAALYNLLTGLFTFIDEQVEPKKLGVITSDKMKWVAEQVGMQAEFAGMVHLFFFFFFFSLEGSEEKKG